MIPHIQLAPMEGVLDWTLREMLAEIGGIDRMVTEFVRVTDRLLPEHVFFKYSPELRNMGKTRTGVPVFIQLLGGHPEPMAANAEQAVKLGAPGIDLNFGCPAKTVNRHDGGAVLLKSPHRLFAITQSVRRAVPKTIPVTAKVRLGYENKDLHREIASAILEGGASSLVVHARTKLEMYRPPAHWDYIAKMQDGISIPIAANGEIWSIKDYKTCAEVSRTKNVALGRGLVARPFLAREIKRLDENNSTLPSVNFNYLQFFEKFKYLNLELAGPRFAIARLKQLARYWSLDQDGGAKNWFDQIKGFQDIIQFEEFISKYRTTMDLYTAKDYREQEFLKTKL